jgi:hypothetical protein
MFREPDFPFLHDLARHAIHSSETLDVAVDILTNMMRQHELLTHTVNSNGAAEATASRVKQHLCFQAHMLRSLRSRSVAIEHRLRNEINLVSF